MSFTHAPRVLLLCNAGMVCVAIGAGVLPVFLTTFSETFGGLGPAELGALPGLLFAGFVVGIVLSGPLADRFGARLFAMGGTGLCAGGLLLAAAAPNFGWLLAAAGCIGLGAGILDMLMSPLVAAVATDRRARAMNRLHAFYSIGVVATVLIASGSLWLTIPWRAVMVGLAVLPASVMVGFAGCPLPPLVHPDHERSRLLQLLLMPRFHLALLMIMLTGATEEGMSQWLPAYAESELGYGKATAGFALAAYAVAQTVGRFIGSSAGAGHIGPYGLLAMGSLASACCYSIAAWASAPPVALAACVLAGLACSMLWPTLLGVTADRIPHGGATLFGLMAAAGNLGCVLGTWAEGQVAAKSNLHVALGLGALAPLLLAGCTAWCAWLDRRARLAARAT